MSMSKRVILVAAFVLMLASFVVVQCHIQGAGAQHQMFSLAAFWPPEAPEWAKAGMWGFMLVWAICLNLWRNPS